MSSILYCHVKNIESLGVLVVCLVTNHPMAGHTSRTNLALLELTSTSLLVRDGLFIPRTQVYLLSILLIDNADHRCELIGTRID